MSDDPTPAPTGSSSSFSQPIFVIWGFVTVILIGAVTVTSWYAVKNGRSADARRAELEAEKERARKAAESAAGRKSNLPGGDPVRDELRRKLDLAEKSARSAKLRALYQLAAAFDVLRKGNFEDVEEYRRNIARALAIAFQKLGKELSTNDEGTTVETAMAWSKMGQLLDVAGDSDSALRMHNLGIKNLERLRRLEPNRLLVHVGVASAYFYRSIHQRKRRKFAEALNDAQASLKAHTTVINSAGDAKPHVAAAADVVQEMVQCYTEWGLKGAAQKSRESHRKFLAVALRLDPKNVNRHVDLYLSYRQSGLYERKRGNLQGAAKHFAGALKTLEALSVLQPGVLIYREKAVENCGTLQEIHQTRNDAQSSLQVARKAVQIGDALRAERPVDTEHLQIRHAAAGIMANHHARFGKKPDARKLLEASEAEFVRLAAARPGDAAAQKALAQVQGALAGRLAEWGEDKAAEAAATRGNKTIQAYLKKHPGDRSVLTVYAAQLMTSSALKNFDDPRPLESSLAIVTKLLKSEPDDRHLRAIRAHGRVKLAGALSGKGRNRDAVERFQAALTDFRALDKSGELDADELREAGFCAVKTGRLHLALGERDKALPAFREATGWLQRALDAYAKQTNFSTKNAAAAFNAALARQNIISAYEGLGRFQEAIQMSRDLIKQIDDNTWIAKPAQRMELKHGAQWHLAMALVRSGRYEEGLKTIEQVRDSGGVSAMALYNVACVCSVAAEKIANDPAIAAAERKTRSEKPAAAAAAVLRRLRDHEALFQDPSHVEWAKADADLKFLRAHPVHGRLFQQLAKPLPTGKPKAKPAG